MAKRDLSKVKTLLGDQWCGCGAKPGVGLEPSAECIGSGVYRSQRRGEPYRYSGLRVSDHPLLADAMSFDKAAEERLYQIESEPVVTDHGRPNRPRENDDAFARHHRSFMAELERREDDLVASEEDNRITEDGYGILHSHDRDQRPKTKFYGLTTEIWPGKVHLPNIANVSTGHSCFGLEQDPNAPIHKPTMTTPRPLTLPGFSAGPHGFDTDMYDSMPDIEYPYPLMANMPARDIGTDPLDARIYGPPTSGTLFAADPWTSWVGQGK